ncbi:MAG: diadenylate cyclase CdaA [Clostridiales bacterium]|nr:diadenylate cyclase CdaA [Eubacteriales bacterium]MDH7565976.1 diadenylate cyclase CdaA [Clostridiales bacterium]
MLEFLKALNIGSLANDFASYFGIKSPLDIVKAIVDIGVVSYVIYKLIFLVRETRALQLIKGIAFVLAAYYISDLLGLRTFAYILKNTIQIVGLALVVLFQPELRRGLEQIGRSRFRNFFNFEEVNGDIQTTAVIEEVIRAATELSKTCTGALIVIERDTKIGEIINTGIRLDSSVTCELLINIFTPNTPLHDGAVVVRENRIAAAACFLPLTDNPNLSKELGTRHRAALGITEVSDSIVVVVSEETGKISFALNGGLTRNLTPDTLRKALNKNLLEKKNPGKKISLWKVKTR